MENEDQRSKAVFSQYHFGPRIWGWLKKIKSATKYIIFIYLVLHSVWRYRDFMKSKGKPEKEWNHRKHKKAPRLWGEKHKPKDKTTKAVSLSKGNILTFCCLPLFIMRQENRAIKKVMKLRTRWIPGPEPVSDYVQVGMKWAAWPHLNGHFVRHSLMSFHIHHRLILTDQI